MQPRTIFISGLIFVSTVVFFNSVFIISQKQQAVILQFGDPVNVINEVGQEEAGLHIKAPFVQTVQIFDKRNLGLEIPAMFIVAADKERLLIDTFIRWKITDPLKLYQSVRDQNGANGQLTRMTETAVRNALGSVTSTDIVSGQRGNLMTVIRDNLNGTVAGLGVEIIDVRIRKADLPKENSEKVFERMRTERQLRAALTRAEGEEEALDIRAGADRSVTVILAEAREQAEKIRGEGDSIRNRVYAEAYGKDPEFFAFYRAMTAYETAINDGTPIVLSPDSDFFKYFGTQTSSNDR